MKQENQFILSVHKWLPKDIYHEKMANPYRGGTPDVWYSRKKGGDCWIEYKYLAKLPIRGAVTPQLSELQKRWLTGRHNEGRSVGVIVGCSDGGAFFPALTGLCSYPAKEFAAVLLTRKELARAISSYCGENDENLSYF